MNAFGAGCSRMEAMEFAKLGHTLPNPFYSTENGLLFEGDCLDILVNFGGNLIDTVFADPPPLTLAKPTDSVPTIRWTTTNTSSGVDDGSASACASSRRAERSSSTIYQSGASFWGPTSCSSLK
jgi:hypothetical protein